MKHLLDDGFFEPRKSLALALPFHVDDSLYLRRIVILVTHLALAHVSPTFGLATLLIPQLRDGLFTTSVVNEALGHCYGINKVLNPTTFELSLCPWLESVHKVEE
ncbi:hypothetical protein V6N13_018928 [Hibiscus sabdariffa]